jgi:hypothetical protein
MLEVTKMTMIVEIESETDDFDAIRITAISYANTAKDEEAKNQFLSIAERIEKMLSGAWEY